MTSRPASLAVAGLLALGLLAGCTTSSAGHGNPSTLAHPVSSSATSSAISSTTSAAPSPDAYPTVAAVCTASTCRSVATCSVGPTYSAHLWDQPGGAAGDSAELDLADHSGILAHYRSAYLTPQSLACASSSKGVEIVVLGGDGAHASTALAFQVAGPALGSPATTTGDTPEMHAVDLDGDGWLDLVVVQDDYTPNYAQGRLYFQTFRYDGSSLTSTGCSAPSLPVGPQPTRFETGACPH